MALPIPQPSYIFRGHSSPIHHTSFIRSNTRLVTGDSEGHLVFWSVATRRPVACWRAHEGAILEVKEWGAGRLITHGKDNALRVWKFREADEATLDKTLPVDGQGAANRKPWLLYELPVNTLNFCSFGMYVAQDLSGAKVVVEQISEERQLEKKGSEEYDDLLIAVPNTLISEAVDIFHLPSCKRLMTVPGPQESGKPINVGMVMALSLLYLPSPSSSSQKPQPPRLTLITGYESGHTYVQQVLPGLGWTPLYLAHLGKQPILSLGVHPGRERAWYLTSGADAVVVKHPLASLSPSLPSSISNTPQPTSSPKAASTQPPRNDEPSKPQSLLSALLKSASSTSQSSPPPKIKVPELHTQPLKVNNTKHAGQQSLVLRSDGKIFATAGWDGRARVYSAKTSKEVAVLKWHKEGVFTVGFAAVVDGVAVEKEEGGEEETALVKKVGTMSVAQKRIKEATVTHWIAVGGKDGKVSLWDIY